MVTGIIQGRMFIRLLTHNTYAKDVLKLGNVFDPGRLPTIQVTGVDASNGAISEVQILDG